MINTAGFALQHHMLAASTADAISTHTVYRCHHNAVAYCHSGRNWPLALSALVRHCSSSPPLTRALVNTVRLHFQKLEHVGINLHACQHSAMRAYPLLHVHLARQAGVTKPAKLKVRMRVTALVTARLACTWCIGKAAGRDWPRTTRFCQGSKSGLHQPAATTRALRALA